MAHSACNWIDGQAVPFAGPHQELVSPLDGRNVASVPWSDASVVDAAVEAALRAQPGWGARTLRQRSQVAYDYRRQLITHRAELAELIHLENGKSVAEADAELTRAIEVTEFACSLPQLAAGEVLDVSPGVECRTERHPVGVGASITPFNFPAMVPHWTIPIALTLGNSLVLKPSERAPLTASRCAELLSAAGLPHGVFSVVHGGRAVVEALCDHPGIDAVTFVGSTTAARAVYVRATATLKRALALGGAKNHLIVLPDAAVESAAENIVGSMAGCAGQRCMAAANLLAVGEVGPVLKRVCEIAGALVPGPSLGPVISADSKRRIVEMIGEAERAGARVLVDGRDVPAPGHETGFYLGATVLDDVRPEMRIAREEVFGPVLSILRVDSLDEALALENGSPFGNAAAIYTRDGAAARLLARRAGAGMIGVNVGVPVPLEPFGFGGWSQSRFGVGDITGRSAIDFWTQTKKVTTRW